jgi:protein NRD1
LQEFEALLKEVVLAKRLSASKMNNLTDIAMRNMEVRSIINLLTIVV